MANSKLLGRKYNIPEYILNHFNIILTNYEKVNGNKHVQGYVRLKNLIDKKNISYENMKKVKNFFDRYQNLSSAKQSENETEYKLTGGSKFKKWIDDTLNAERNATELVDLSEQIKNKVQKTLLRFIYEAEYNNDGKLLAAGVYPISKSTGRILLQQRGATINNPLEWSNWGGKTDKGETPKQTALREFQEESGYEGEILELIKSKVYENDDVVFSNYIAIVQNEFTPPMVGEKTVDGDIEVSNYRWATLEELHDFDGKFHKGVADFIDSEYDKLKQIILDLN